MVGETILVGLVGELVDRLIQLVQARKQSRKQLLDEQITPVFSAFESVHQHYLSSFAKYRDIIKTSTEPLTLSHPIIDLIASDNLFTQHEREKILQLGDIIADSKVKNLILLVRDYLVDTRVASEPMEGYKSKPFKSNPQHWRRTLLEELNAIFREQWQIILDRDASRPPLYDSEQKEALAEIQREIGIQENDIRALDKTKAYFAVKAIDEVVEEMQEAYTEVNGEYLRLGRELLK